MREEDQIKTSFTWFGKHYKFVGTPFGLKHVPSVFQKVMGKLFADLNHVFVYVDDIIIHSVSSITYITYTDYSDIKLFYY
jgi:hypothetical protein